MLRTLLRRFAAPLLKIAAVVIAAIIFIPKLMAGKSSGLAGLLGFGGDGGDADMGQLSTQGYLSKQRELNERYNENRRALDKDFKNMSKELRREYKSGTLSQKDYEQRYTDLENRYKQNRDLMDKDYTSTMQFYDSRYKGGSGDLKRPEVSRPEDYALSEDSAAAAKARAMSKDSVDASGNILPMNPVDAAIKGENVGTTRKWLGVEGRSRSVEAESKALQEAMTHPVYVRNAAGPNGAMCKEYHVYGYKDTYPEGIPATRAKAAISSSLYFDVKSKDQNFTVMMHNANTADVPKDAQFVGYMYKSANGGSIVIDKGSLSAVANDKGLALDGSPLVAGQGGEEKSVPQEEHSIAADNAAECHRIAVVRGEMKDGKWQGNGPTTFYCDNVKGAEGALRRYHMEHGYSKQDFNKLMFDGKFRIRPMSEMPVGVEVSGSLYMAGGAHGVKVLEAGQMMEQQGKGAARDMFNDMRAQAEVSLRGMAGKGGVPEAAEGVPSGLVARCDSKDAINIYDGKTKLATVRLDPTSASGIRSDLTEAGKSFKMSDGRMLSNLFPADGNVSGIGKGLGDIFTQMTGPANMEQIQQGVDMQHQREADLQQDSQAAQNYLSQAGGPAQGPSLAGGLAG